MPTADEILAGLHGIANDWRPLAVVWHGYFAILIGGLVLGMRPTKRVAGTLLALPLFSVSVLAWLHANPFNGTVFALAGGLLLAIAARLGPGRAEAGSPRLAVPGVLLIGFGWIYPHFLDDAGALVYLYAAPTGLIPCPTLSIVTGLTLTLGGLGSRAWCSVLATVGLFYGVFGAVRLDVEIDWVLFLGACATAYAAFSPRSSGNSRPATGE